MASTLKHLGGLLGILQDDPDAFLQGKRYSIIGSTTITLKSSSTMKYTSANEHIEQQIHERLDAKKAKNWALADQIRDDLKKQGVILEDAPNGTTSWRRE